MRILFYQWNAFMQKGIENALQRQGISYDIFFYQFECVEKWENDPVFVDKLEKKIRAGGYDTIFSVNYVPLISLICNQEKIHYISWVYDCPLHIRNEEPMKLSCNDIYFFDRVQAEGYRDYGVKGAHYLPLAVDTQVFEGSGNAGNGKNLDRYDCDVSLLGQLYTSKYQHICGPLNQYTRGYLEGCIAAQQQIAGGYILPEMVTDQLVDSLNAQFAIEKDGKDGYAVSVPTQISRRELMYLLACEATGRNRVTALALLQNRCRVQLVSKDRNPSLSQVEMLGYVDYYTRMPEVFRKSKINLNISLTAISSGIPLRVLDIMGSGGFVMSNYQSELLEYFEQGKEIVIYEDFKDLVLKAQYYLEHDAEREEIVWAGYRKVQELFTFDERIKVMFGRNEDGFQLSTDGENCVCDNMSIEHSIIT